MAGQAKTFSTPKNYGGGWAIVVGGAGLYFVGGTRFGPLAAGLTSLALLFQLVSLAGGKSGAKLTSAQAGKSSSGSSLSGILGTPAPPPTPSVAQAFNLA